MKKFLTLAAISMLLLASCQKKESEMTAPIPPSAESLAIDLDLFRTDETKSLGGAADSFEYVSVKIVANWLNIFDNIINVPVEAYKQLIVSAVPVQNGKGWTWTIDYKDVFNQHYTVTLYGEEIEDKVNWELRVSCNDGAEHYENFTWLTGWSSKDGKSGQWQILVGPNDAEVLVTADWAVNGKRDSTVKLTYHLDHQIWGIPRLFNESYIIYSTTTSDATYDTSIESYYNHEGLGFWKVNVEWNSVTGAGRVMSSSYFGDTHWHCWDQTD